MSRPASRRHSSRSRSRQEGADGPEGQGQEEKSSRHSSTLDDTDSVQRVEIQAMQKQLELVTARLEELEHYHK